MQKRNSATHKRNKAHKMKWAALRKAFKKSKKITVVVKEGE